MKQKPMNHKIIPQFEKSQILSKSAWTIDAVQRNEYKRIYIWDGVEIKDIIDDAVKPLLTEVSTEEMRQILSIIFAKNGTENFKISDMIKIDWLGTGQYKVALKLTFSFLDKNQKIEKPVALKIFKDRNRKVFFTPTLEHVNYQNKLKTEGIRVPIIGSRIFTVANQFDAYFEEYIEGQTSAQLFKSSTLTTEHLKSILKLITEIFIKTGTVPDDMNASDVIFSNTGEDLYLIDVMSEKLCKSIVYPLLVFMRTYNLGSADPQNPNKNWFIYNTILEIGTKFKSKELVIFELTKLLNYYEDLKIRGINEKESHLFSELFDYFKHHGLTYKKLKNYPMT